MRAFIVGNGPSLRETPLEKLKGEHTFATNRIGLIYPHTTWRPEIYVRAEEAGGLDTNIWKDDLMTHYDMGIEVWCNMWFVKRLALEGIDVRDKTNVIAGCSHYLNNFDQEQCPHLWHLPMLCTFGSSINVAIQIAVTEGFDEIFLVGCDLGYKDEGANHFADNYEDGLSGHLRPAKYANLNTLAAHMVAARSTKIPIYNATIGGHLEAYPRVDLKKLL